MLGIANMYVDTNVNYDPSHRNVSDINSTNTIQYILIVFTFQFKSES